ncbi:hypothetical protein ACE5IS_17560 [Leptospira wolffii]|uniref:GtrA-like protein domain-containing protein n=1 Tax=Leptospira wolffii TaxID=409998 RepID=A0ABV5BS77_9LEPT|nr:hypothetical protein [Leptospira wolffii]TGL51822.1 hypothetical protein EHQ61_07625 [Leptospira wolffii]
MQLSHLSDRFRRNSYLIFLIDGLGALVSASFLGIVLVQFEAWIGIPTETLYLLAVVACLFSAYSLFFYAKRPGNWRIYLRIIAIANLVYCLGTLSILLYYKESIRLLGILYFLGEKTIVIALASFELRLSNQK